tara:strand:+ start:72206 stop:72877 length:672 start_codon:yes stop_codon:yes gene_type:complete
MLTLIPTPIDEIHELEQTALNLLKKVQDDPNAIICVEEAKIARRRWIRWGLKREKIDEFVLYNEHTRDELVSELIAKMQSGKNIYLMSDCGLPAFCDPGQRLVSAAHSAQIKVSATPFYNSTILALALSGIKHDKFVFEGFLPTDKTQRAKEMKRIANNKITTIIMDTPYRLNSLIDDFKNLCPNRDAFIAMDLNKAEESLIAGKLSKIKLEKQKREFILVLG